MRNQYLIISESERDHETGKLLYWSNGVGWVNLTAATVFSPNERKTLTLPIGGKWIQDAREATGQDQSPERLDEAQVGGDHYKKRAFTPWQIIDEYGLDFYAGNALKYLLRAKDKNGLEDLKKCRHYLDKLIQLLESKNAGDKQP